MEGALTIRPRIVGDDARIVEIHNQQEADSVPLTLQRYREEHATDLVDPKRQQWVAAPPEQVVGFGAFSPAWWTGKEGTYAIELQVDRDQRRQGIGTALYHQLRSRLVELQAVRLLAWLRADATEGRRFATRQGFEETGQVIEEYRLYIPDATTDRYADLDERLQREGLRLVSLAELEARGEPFLHKLHSLWADSGGEPADPEQLQGSFHTWQQQVLHSPGLSRETHWVALDGDRPVGMTFLKRLSADAAENDYTGVAPSYRGRGIAQALKLHAIAWAQQNDMTWFYTSSELGNTPMLTINRQLGYQPGARRIEVAITSL